MNATAPNLPRKDGRWPRRSGWLLLTVAALSPWLTAAVPDEGNPPPNRSSDQPRQTPAIFSTYRLAPLPPLATPSPTPATDPARREAGLRLLVAARDSARAAATGKDQALSSIATAQARAGEFAAARETLEGTKDGIMDTDATQARCRVAVEQAKQGDVAGAKAALAAIRADHSNQGDRVADALEDIVREQLRRGDIAGARQTARSIQKTDTYHSGVPRSFALQYIAAAQAKAGDLAGAEAAIRKFKDRDDRAYALDDIVTDQYAAGDLTAAIATARLMPVSKGFCTQGSELKDMAFDLAAKGDLAGTQRCAEGIIDPELKDIARAAVAVLQALQGDDAAAAATTKLIHYPLARDSALRRLGLVLGQRGDVPGSRRMFAGAIEVSQTPEVRKKYVVGFWIEEIVRWQLNTGDIEGAVISAATKQTETKEWKVTTPDIWADVAAAQARANDVDGARRTLAKIDDDQPKAGALAEIANAQFLAGDDAGARQTAREAAKLVAGHKKSDGKIVGKVAVALAEAGDVDAATALAVAQQPADVYRDGVGGLQDLASWLAETRGFPAAAAWAAALADPLLRAYVEMTLAMRRLNLPPEGYTGERGDECTC